MLAANKDTKAINAFIDVPIPSPKDYFARYGARVSSGVLSVDDFGEEPNPINFSNTVISSVIRGQKLVSSQFQDNKISEQK